MMNVRIYNRSKETSQSGHANSGQWVLEAVRPSTQKPESLMGWTQSGDTLNQIKLSFPNQAKAEAFAKSQGWRYTITKQNNRKVKPRSYADNFVYEASE